MEDLKGLVVVLCKGRLTRVGLERRFPERNSGTCLLRAELHYR
jgi:hypothetical protein